MHPHLLSAVGNLLPLLLAQPHRPGPATPVRRMPPRHRTTWAPAGGGRAERASSMRQIQAGTLNASSGLTPIHKGERP